MKKALVLGIALALALACKKDVEEKAKDAINESGKAVEETANKVVDEVSSHFERDKGCTLALSEELKAKGITTGKFYIEKDTVTKNDNKLVIYLITEKDFKGNVSFKATDKDGTEAGRATLKLDSKAGEAGYKDVLFDNRTDIESKSTISIN